MQSLVVMMKSLLVLVTCMTSRDGKNTITDGGVASPPLLLTIVMMSSNSKSLRISQNSKDSGEGQDRIVGSARSPFAQADTDYQFEEFKTVGDCHRLPPTVTD